MPKPKKCFIPCCQNTSVNSLNKLFLIVPEEKNRQERWFQTVGFPVPQKRILKYCCEDHFNLEEDMDNWLQYKLMGSRIMMKPDVVPHKYIRSPPSEPLPPQFTISDRKQKRENIAKFKQTEEIAKLKQSEKLSKHEFIDECFENVIIQTKEIPSQLTDNESEISIEIIQCSEQSLQKEEYTTIYVDNSVEECVLGF